MLPSSNEFCLIFVNAFSVEICLVCIGSVNNRYRLSYFRLNWFYMVLWALLRKRYYILKKSLLDFKFFQVLSPPNSEIMVSHFCSCVCHFISLSVCLSIYSSICLFICLFGVCFLSVVLLAQIRFKELRYWHPIWYKSNLEVVIMRLKCVKFWKNYGFTFSLYFNVGYL